MNLKTKVTIIICLIFYFVTSIAITLHGPDHAFITRGGNSMDLLCDDDHCIVTAENTSHKKMKEDIGIINSHTDRDWVNNNIIMFRMSLGTNYTITHFFNFKTLQFSDAYVDIVAVDSIKNIVAFCIDADAIQVEPIFDSKTKPIIIKRNFIGAAVSAIDSQETYFTENGDLFLSYGAVKNGKYHDGDELIKINFPHKKQPKNSIKSKWSYLKNI